MRIWIDGFEANVPQRLGSGQVAFELIKNIEKLDKRNDYTVVLPGEPLSDMPKSRPGFRYKILKPSFLWTNFSLPLALARTDHKPDLIFSPTHYIPRFLNIKRIVTVFDLSYLHYPQFFLKTDLYKLTNWTKYSIKHAAHIITISKSSKKDIQKNYNIDSKKITICYPGYNADKFKPDFEIEKIEEVKAKYKINSPYILFIGTVQPRKNLHRLIEAMVKIDNLKLVIVGKITGEGRQAWMNEDIIKLPDKLGISQKIIFTGFVPDEDKLQLLGGATAFALPSLWEGFGIPVVEALACGIPVIVSHTSSLPEVAGEAGLLVDPKSVTQIEQAIRIVSSDLKLRKKLTKKALVQAEKFSWKKMAKEVIKVLENV